MPHLPHPSPIPIRINHKRAQGNFSGCWKFSKTGLWQWLLNSDFTNIINCALVLVNCMVCAFYLSEAAEGIECD